MPWLAIDMAGWSCHFEDGIDDGCCSICSSLPDRGAVSAEVCISLALHRGALLLHSDWGLG